LSQKTPFLVEKRFRWIRRTGGRRDSVKLLLAVLAFLHFGQFLRARKGGASGGETVSHRHDETPRRERDTHQALPFSMTSSLTNESRQCSSETLCLSRLVGTGSERYMKASKVVDVCGASRKTKVQSPGRGCEGWSRASPDGTSSIPSGSCTGPGKGRRRDCRCASCRSATPSRRRFGSAAC
jgi:hypothetical protein